MDQEVREVEGLLGIPSPDLVWHTVGNTGNYYADWEGLRLFIELTASQPVNFYRWVIRDSRKDRHDPSYIKGNTESLEDAKREARECLIRKLS